MDSAIASSALAKSKTGLKRVPAQT
jgi:hypothetical protein